MTEELIKQNSIELINKLSEKFDKCKWKKCPLANPVSRPSDCSPDFMLKLNSGSVQISKDTIYVCGLDTMIYKYKATAENGTARKLAVLWGKVYDSIQKPIESQVISLISELDKL